MALVTTNKIKLGLTAIFTALLILCLTVAGYACQYHWYEYSSLSLGTNEFSLWDYKLTFGSTTITKSNYVCATGATDCNTDDLNLARRSANAALALSIILFLSSFIFLRVSSGAIAKLFGFIFVLGNLAYILCDIIALGSLGTFVTTYLSIKADDLSVQWGANCFVAALLISFLVQLVIGFAYTGLFASCFGRWFPICRPNDEEPALK